MNYNYLLCDGMIVYGHTSTPESPATALEIASGGISYYRMRGGERTEARSLFVSAVEQIYSENFPPRDWGRAEYDYDSNALNVAKIIRQRGYRRGDAIRLIHNAVHEAFSRPEY